MVKEGDYTSIAALSPPLSELRSCEKVEVSVINKPTVSVDIKQHSTNYQNDSCIKMGSDESHFDVS